MDIFLRDRNPKVVQAWRHFFGRGARVDISEGDIFDLAVSAFVVPLNSYGIMYDGLALELNRRSNSTLEPRVRKMILDRHAGELPVGTAEIMPSGLENPPLVVLAPTVRVPAPMQATPNAQSFLATRAALRAVAAFMRNGQGKGKRSEISAIALVGMGTGGGHCPPATAAFQMYEAYCQIVLGQIPNFATIEAAVAHDQELRKNRFL
jgi:O-acetyl-ADP-ribose deacetylase (regulator of RNase III)